MSKGIGVVAGVEQSAFPSYSPRAGGPELMYILDTKVISATMLQAIINVVIPSEVEQPALSLSKGTLQSRVVAILTRSSPLDRIFTL